MKEKLHICKVEIVLYITTAALLLATYLVIAKFMPMIMQCRVIIG